jgi:MoaA/NifB/PqqE/SkfB family radical SAM enzyme
MEYYPKQAVWKLNLHCNLNCLHCGSQAGKNTKKELTLDECFNIAEQLIGMGCQYLTLIKRYRNLATPINGANGKQPRITLN